MDSNLFFTYSDVCSYISEAKKKLSLLSDEDLINSYGLCSDSECLDMDIISTKFFSYNKLSELDRNKAIYFYILYNSDNFWRV